MSAPELAALDRSLNAEMRAQEADHRRATCAARGHTWGRRVLIIARPFPAGYTCTNCGTVAR